MKYRWLPIMLVLLAVPAALFGQSKEEQRLQESATVMREILGMPEGIPQNILNKAACVVVFPSVKKFAIGIGGSYGRGAITCRSGKDFRGPWSAPAMFGLEAANIGLQLGGQATDFVLLVMNEKGGDSVMSSKVKLGTDAAAAAGPKGRDTSASTDVVMKAEILSYSRSRGLFGGISLEGSTLRSDDGANKKVYGKDLSTKQIVREGAVQPTAGGKELISVLGQKSPKRVQ